MHEEVGSHGRQTLGYQGSLREEKRTNRQISAGLDEERCKNRSFRNERAKGRVEGERWV